MVPGICANHKSTARDPRSGAGLPPRFTTALSVRIPANLVSSPVISTGFCGMSRYSKNKCLLYTLPAAGRAQWYSTGQGLEIFLFTTVSRPVLEPTQFPIQWLPGALSLGVKRPEQKVDHSPPSSAEVKNTWCYTSISQYVFLVWCLVKNRHNFTFTLPYLYRV